MRKLQKKLDDEKEVDILVEDEKAKFKQILSMRIGMMH